MAVGTSDGRRCSDCKKRKPASEFYPDRRRGRLWPYCKACSKLRNRAAYEVRKQDPEWVARITEENRQRRARLRQQVIEAYGSACACCDERTPEFLTIDHVNNDGAAHRREVGRSARMCLDIVRRGFPPDFQLLCWNCNGAKGAYGVCPHERDRQAA
jgi:hypothetical protein